MPGDRLGSKHLNVDPGTVASFHDKAQEHGDAGAVEEVQFSKIEHNRHRGTGRGFIGHVENGRVIIRPTQTLDTGQPIEADCGHRTVLLLVSPSRPLSGKWKKVREKRDKSLRRHRTRATTC
jgi:hypothetical protein